MERGSCRERHLFRERRSVSCSAFPASLVCLLTFEGVYGRPSQPAPLTHQPPGLKSFKGDFHFFNAFNQDFEGKRRACYSSQSQRIRSGDSLSSHDNLSDLHQNRTDTTEYSQTHPNLRLQMFDPCGSSAADHYDRYLFDFYLHGLGPGLSNSPTQNPYLEFIAPLSLSSAPLYHSVLSWSAHELAFRNPNDQSCRRASVQHKVKALQGLQEEIRLSQSTSAPCVDTLTSVLSTMIILSCQEIVETCSSAWIAHLRAARMLCSLLFTSCTSFSDSFRRFCVMWFVSHEIMSRTAWIQETLFEPSEWFAGDDESEIDAMIGCSRGLIQQISCIGALIMEKRKGIYSDSASSILADRRNDIEDALHKLGQRLSTSHVATPTELLEVAESKRLCALIYLYTCIDDATPSTPIIKNLTARVMKILSRLPPKPSLTFPLFVVGTLGVWNEDDRRIVLDKFSKMVETRPLASIVRAADIVKAVWLDRDLGKRERWEDLVETRGKLLSLA